MGRRPHPPASNRPHPPRTDIEEHALSVSAWRPREPAACGLPQPAAPPAANGRTVTVYFTCDPPSGAGITVPARIVLVPPGADPMATSLQALLAGPTPKEKEAGYVSNFGRGSANIGFRVRVQDDSVAIADFDPAITKIPMAFVTTMESSQIVATLGQFPGIKRVMILVGGQPLSKAVSQ